MSDTERLDNYDRNILNVLQDEGRISYTDLGKKVGLTTTPCIERVSAPVLSKVIQPG